MKRALGLLFIVGVALIRPGVSGAAEHPDLVVVAEIERYLGPFTPCGVMYTIGEIEVRVIRVETGQFAGERMTIEVACPDASFPPNRISRFLLSAHRPRTWPEVHTRSKLTARFYEIGNESLIGGLLGQTAPQIEALFPKTGVDGAWVVYHSDFSVLYDEGRAARLRISIPHSLETESWIGFPHAHDPIRKGSVKEWLTRGHLLAPGVLGRQVKGQLEIWTGAVPTP